MQAVTSPDALVQTEEQKEQHEAVAEEVADAKAGWLLRTCARPPLCFAPAPEPACLCEHSPCR